jgi:iron complex outermembrane receptor protein
MKRLLFSLPLLFTTLCFAQKREYGSIKGVVLTSDGKPAGFVTIVVKDIKNGTTTNDDGRFELKKIKAGNYVIILSLVGFESKEIDVDVKAGEETFVNGRLEQDYAELQKVIVASKTAKYTETNPSSSLRLNMPLNEIPQNIAVTTRQLLTDQGLIAMSEALRTVSGIQRNYGDINDITLNIRGVEALFSIYRNGLGQYWWNQQEDIAMIEKIEFIKGPAGFIVSDFPPGGFVNMITKQPQRDRVASVNIAYGSFNLFRFSTDWGGAFSKKSKFTYRFNAGVHRQQRAFNYSYAERYFICGAFKYEPGKKNTITVEYNYMWGKTRGNNFNVPSVKGKLFSLPRNFAVADSKTDNLIVADNYFRLSATHQFNNNWNINLLLGNIYGKWGQGNQLLADAELPVTNDTLYRYAESDDWHNFSRIAQLYLNGTFHTGRDIEHKLLAALDYHNTGITDRWGATESKFGVSIHTPNYFVNSDSLKKFTQTALDTVRSKNPSFYLEDHIKIKGKIIFTFAGRFTHLSNNFVFNKIPVYQHKTSYNHFTPRIGLNWLFSDVFNAFAVFDQFFNPVYEKNYEHKPFKPLTGYNLEAGIKCFLFNKKLNAILSAYKILTNNAISPDPLHPEYYVQTAQYINKGVEIDMTGNISPAVLVSANYAFTDAKVSRGDANQIGKKKLGTPDQSANVWLKYRWLNGRLNGFSFALGYQYMGRRSAVNIDDPGRNIYLPVYSLFDAAITYRTDKFNINLNVYNLTNIDYATQGYFNVGNDEWRYAPGEPINFRLSAGIDLVRRKKITIR